MLGQEKKKSLFERVFNIIFAIFIIIFVLFLYLKLNYQGYYIVGQSMYPTLHGATADPLGNIILPNGDYVFISKNDKADYGDIIVCNYKSGNSERTIVKRVIAKEGDYVYVKDYKAYVKYKGTSEFVALDERYIYESNLVAGEHFPIENGNLNEEGHLVAEGCVFVLGDHRANSLDSRSSEVGDILCENILGVVTEWSLNNKEWISNIYNFIAFGA